MLNSNTTELNCQIIPRATLVALGLKIRQLGIVKTMADTVKIEQKTIKDSPTDKLTDALVTILAGGQGLVEANTRLRSDRALQLAFGRSRCAEQSVISETLNACTALNVSQLEQAVISIYQAHSAGYAHNYDQEWQVLEVDLSGQPCGPKAAFASKGYFAHQRNRRGRQLGRVYASLYEEVVVDQLYPGQTTLPQVLQALVSRAAQVLELNRAKRSHTILRIDGHGGSRDDVNWLLEQGYQFQTKEYSAQRARLLAESVTTWYDDPRVPDRQVGWVTLLATEYIAPVKRIAVRTRKRNGQYGVGVILSTLSATLVRLLTGCHPDQDDPRSTLLAYVYFYDQRGGGIEIGLKQDKQGLGVTKRNKKSFPAQQMLTQLNALAHNLLIWGRDWLAQRCQSVAKLGLLRLVRDVLCFNGVVFLTLTRPWRRLS
ncbi:MAG: transposase [Anaerolineae bacterium]|nr:transposase [Anaerolineae bacterium]